MITENTGEGTDTVNSSVTYTIASLANLENITLTGTAAINATGNAANNTIWGYGGDDLINGGSGNESIRGPRDVWIVFPARVRGRQPHEPNTRPYPRKRGPKLTFNLSRWPNLSPLAAWIPAFAGRIGE